MPYSPYEDHPIIVSLIRDGWNTPDTYSKHFSEIPKASGVYLLLNVDLEDGKRDRIMYVGMSVRLSTRLSGHEIQKLISDHLSWAAHVQRWFKLFPARDLRKTERHFIRLHRPPYNIIGRVRGEAWT